MADKTTMRWVTEQGEYIARLARLPYAGDDENVAHIKRELESTLRVLTKNHRGAGEPA